MSLGVMNRYLEKDWRVQVSIFRFKFDLKGYAINFCVKYNIDLDKIYFHGIVEVYRL